MAFQEKIKTMKPEQIREMAATYDSNEKAVNSFGSTFSDFMKGDLRGERAALRKAAHDWVMEYDQQQAKLKNNETMNSLRSATSERIVQSAAHTMGGFDVNKFVKQEQQQTVAGPTTSPTQRPVSHPHVHEHGKLPHETCGLTDQEIIEDVGKHFGLYQQGIPSYALYDLLHNPMLSKKMKELNSKQRSNNPYLTQVVMEEYTDNPEVFQRYNLAFTIPCKDKGFVIMVFYNTNAVMDPCGCLTYPLNIFKAKLTKPGK